MQRVCTHHQEEVKYLEGINGFKGNKSDIPLVKLIMKNAKYFWQLPVV